jgi:hypothetical protein
MVYISTISTLEKTASLLKPGLVYPAYPSLAVLCETNNCYTSEYTYKMIDTTIRVRA